MDIQVLGFTANGICILFPLLSYVVLFRKESTCQFLRESFTPASISKRNVLCEALHGSLKEYVSISIANLCLYLYLYHLYIYLQKELFCSSPKYRRAGGMHYCFSILIWKQVRLVWDTLILAYKCHCMGIFLFLPPTWRVIQKSVVGVPNDMYICMYVFIYTIIRAVISCSVYRCFCHLVLRCWIQSCVFVFVFFFF